MSILKHAFIMDQEEAAEMETSLRRGDESVIEPLLFHYIRHAHRLAHTYAERYPKHFDDLESIAYIALWKAIKAQLGKEDERPLKPYLSSAIHHNIRNYLEKLPLVPIPRDQYRKMLETGVKHAVEVWELVDYIKTSPSDHLDFVDFCDYMCFDDREKLILAQYIQRYTFDEIAVNLGLSKQRVHQILQKIRANVRKKLGLRQ